MNYPASLLLFSAVLVALLATCRLFSQQEDSEQVAETPMSPLAVKDLGKGYRYDTLSTPDCSWYGESDSGGSSSVRRYETYDLKWKQQGYYQRNRELGQTFFVPVGGAFSSAAVALRTGNSRSAVLEGTAGAGVYLQLFAVQSIPVINDNGTPMCTPSAHGFTHNHRAVDYLESIIYEPLAVFGGGRLPDLPATTANGNEPVYLRSFRWQLPEPILLTGEQHYAFLVGFRSREEVGGFTLGNHIMASEPDPTMLETDAKGQGC